MPGARSAGCLLLSPQAACGVVKLPVTLPLPAKQIWQHCHSDAQSEDRLWDAVAVVVLSRLYLRTRFIVDLLRNVEEEGGRVLFLWKGTEARVSPPDLSPLTRSELTRGWQRRSVTVDTH